MATSSPHRPIDVSIVIPVFNKAELTRGCLDALAATTRGVPHEVIVIDNGSTDATPQLLASRPAVRCIRNDVNGGFAAACNQGAAAARGTHLLFLNNDTVPLAGWIEPLVQEFRERPDLAMAGAKLLYPNGLVQHAGVAFARESRSPFHPYRGLLADDPRVNRRRELQAVTAACVLISREWFARAGGFDQAFRNSYEDLDLCLNVRRQGGVIVYQPRSAVIHLESQTPGRTKFDDANRALFFRKWADWLLADEDAYFLADGYRLVYRHEDWRSVGRLVPITDEADRRAWQMVADVQRLAAEGQWPQASARLEDVEAWPADAAVRRWAAAVCFRLDRRAAGVGHLRRSLELEPSSEALLHWAQIDPDGTAFAGAGAFGDGVAGEEGAATAAVQVQLTAIRDFTAGRFEAAHDAFERALVEGASSREAIFGMAAAAAEAGNAAIVRQCCAALLARRPADPLATALRQRIDARGSRSRPAAPETDAPGLWARLASG